ncbi:hypothetical protein Syun_009245 [Stephania yunnanensis]|uniref:Uncharacterized protein n=1 Tax=Stephania yunnanensis TaxID=152371 RepID=A0AAP0KE25_9MAGN
MATAADRSRSHSTNLIGKDADAPTTLPKASSQLSSYLFHSTMSSPFLNTLREKEKKNGEQKQKKDVSVPMVPQKMLMVVSASLDILGCPYKADLVRLCDERRWQGQLRHGGEGRRVGEAAREVGRWSEEARTAAGGGAPEGEARTAAREARDNGENAGGDGGGEDERSMTLREDGGEAHLARRRGRRGAARGRWDRRSR